MFIFQLFARITKLGWFDVIKDEYVFKNVVNDVGQFIQVSYYVQSNPIALRKAKILYNFRLS